MEIIKTSATKNEFEAYQILVMQKENLKKEAIRWEKEYYRVYGDLIKKAFTLKIECISLKKQISYCQSKFNNGEKIQKSELISYIDDYLSEYNSELNRLIDIIEDANAIKSKISLVDYNELKSVYRRIVKKIHPDLNPKLFEREEVKDLWDKVEAAYIANDLDELKGLEILVSLITDSDVSELDIKDIQDRIADIKDEIHTIITTKPYIYKDMVNDQEAIIKKKEELNSEIEEYQKYKAELETILKTFDIEDDIEINLDEEYFEEDIDE